MGFQAHTLPAVPYTADFTSTLQGVREQGHHHNGPGSSRRTATVNQAIVLISTHLHKLSYEEGCPAPA